jgi:hypothetical protein
MVHSQVFFCNQSAAREFQLAAACAMWPPSDRRTGAIRAAAGFGKSKSFGKRNCPVAS